MTTYAGSVGKVLQVREVSDETYASLSRQAAQRGLSLSQFLRDRLDEVARRGEALEHNARILNELHAEITSEVSREQILAALHEGRRERG